MPDYEYRQTVVTMVVPVPDDSASGLAPEHKEQRPIQVPGNAAEFRAVGRIPLKPGWKAAFGQIMPEPETNRGKEGSREAEADGDADQALPQLTDGQTATLTRPRVQAKETQPPPRYNEGTLVDAMQNAWRFVKDEALRERLKEAKGIGTPATRAEIIKSLKRQAMLTADGKLVVPTPAGLQVFELLRGAAPALVDPGTTAVWEMRLDDVVLGRARFHDVIDEIAGEAGRLIGILSRHTGIRVDLTQSPPVSATGGRAKTRSRARAKSAGDHTFTADRVDAKPRKPRTARAARPGPAKTREAQTVSRPIQRHAEQLSPQRRDAASPKPPTERMVGFAQRLARDTGVALPPGYDRDFDICRRFLDSAVRR